MSMRDLRREYDRACKMHKATRSRAWERTKIRLATEILKRGRKAKG